MTYPLVEISPATAPLLTPPLNWNFSQHQIHPLTLLHHTPSPSETPITTSPLPPLLTLLDISTTPHSLTSFLTLCHTHAHCPELLSCTSHFHLSLPGHDPDASKLASDTRIDIETCVQAVGELFDRFQVGKVVGFGVGFGGAVLLNASLKWPGRFAGLCLVSPEIYGGGRLEQFAMGVEGVLNRGMWGSGLSRRVKDRILARWLSDESREENAELVRTLEERMDRLNASNVVRMLEVDAWREDLSGQVGEVGRCLLVTGKESALRWHVDDCFGSFRGEFTSWLDVPGCGSLVHEENSEEVARALALFLQGLPPAQ